MSRKSLYSNWTGPDMDRASEKRAALATIKILGEVRDAMLKSAADGSDLHWITDLAAFDADTRRFLLTTLGTGEVRITLFNGEAKMEETQITGLWKMEVGAQTSLVAALLPDSVKAAARMGAATVTEPEKKPAGLFAAPAILSEIATALETADLETFYTDNPGHQVELTRQPLSPSDANYIFSVLGEGPVKIEMMGFAKSRITATKVRGVWRSEIINNAGRKLLDSIVIAAIPPEVPASPKELDVTAKSVADLIEWIEGDLNRGAIG